MGAGTFLRGDTDWRPTVEGGGASGGVNGRIKAEEEEEEEEDGGTEATPRKSQIKMASPQLIM